MTEQSMALWAKSDPHHALWCHLLDSAAVARILVPRFGHIEGLPDSWIPFLVGCHDVGKADGWFQNKEDELAGQLRCLELQLPEWKVSEPDKYKKFRHEVRSQEWLQEWLKDPTRGWERKALNTVAKAVVGHHGDWQPTNTYTEEDEEKAQWQPLRDELGAMLWTILEPEPISLEAFPHASAAGAKLAAYVVLSDWIASNDKLFPFPTLQKHLDPREYFAASCDLARGVVAQLNLHAPPGFSSSAKPTLAQVWPPDHHPKMTTPRPLQLKLQERREDLKPGLAIIEAPTGEGKTEAAIYLAQLWNSVVPGRGTFFALPTQATSNAMFARYADFLKVWKPNSHARLLHGMAWLRDDLKLEDVEFLPQLDAQTEVERAKEQAHSARDWFRPSRRSLLGEEGVGTVDQALLCALRVKFGTLRLLGLSQKTLIIDECHAYDEFMSEVLERLLQWCSALEINVILLSATLAHAQKMALVRAYAGTGSDWSALKVTSPQEAPYPLLTFTPRDEAAFTLCCAATPERAQTLKLELWPGLLEDSAATARLAAQTVAQGGCLCVLANTVGGAQAIFAELEKLKVAGQLPSDCDLDLFHARFRAQKRAEIESRVVAAFGPDPAKGSERLRPRCAILVATQVVEQSLDVDFDFFISQIAPVDLLLQRAGRLWRHRRGPRACDFPTLVVLTQPSGDWEFGASGKVYQPEILLRTWAILNEGEAQGRQWDLPADFRSLVEKCYRRDADLGAPSQAFGFAEALQKGVEKRDAFRREASSEARKHLWVEPSPRAFEPVARTQSEPDEEGSGESQKYFVARTRLGDESAVLLAIADVALLLQAEADLQNAKLPRDQQKSPPRAVLKQLFGCKVGVPRWWLFDKKAVAEPLEGFAPCFEGKSFLRGHIILPLQTRNGENVWHGQKGNQRFALVDHPTLGLLRRALDSETVLQTPLEADAGEMS